MNNEKNKEIRHPWMKLTIHIMWDVTIKLDLMHLDSICAAHSHFSLLFWSKLHKTTKIQRGKMHIWISCICTHTLADSHTVKMYKNKHKSVTSYGLRQTKAGKNIPISLVSFRFSQWHINRANLKCSCRTHRWGQAGGRQQDKNKSPQLDNIGLLSHSGTAMALS